MTALLRSTATPNWWDAICILSREADAAFTRCDALTRQGRWAEAARYGRAGSALLDQLDVEMARAPR